MDKYKIHKDVTVLLVVDIQTRLYKAMLNPDELCNKVNILLKAADIFELPIIITEQYPKGLGETVPEIKDNVNDCLYIEKLRFSAFTPEFSEKMAELKRKTVIVTGIESHICVFQTVRDLIDNGFKVFVPFDAVSSRSEGNLDNALGLMSEMGAVVSNTETILFDMLGSADSTYFKRISALVK